MKLIITLKQANAILNNLPAGSSIKLKVKDANRILDYRKQKPK